MMTPVKTVFAVAAAGLTFDQPIYESGCFNYMMLKTPDFTNDETTKITILDADGDVVWDMTEMFVAGAGVAAQAKNTTVRYQFEFDIPVHHGWTLRTTLSGVAGGAGGTVKCMLAVKTHR